MGRDARAAKIIQICIKYTMYIYNVVVVHDSFCGTTTLTPELLIEEFDEHCHAASFRASTPARN
jgi:carbonic anhydrase